MKKIILIITVLSFFSIGQAKDVKELYEKCSTCHGDKAEEQAFGKSKIIAELSKEEIIIALKAYKEGTKDEVGLGRLMESQVYYLEPVDMERLAEYITTTLTK